MKKVVSIIILLIQCVSALSGHTVEDKEPAKNTIHLQTGMANGYFRDKVYSPLNYSSSGLAVNTGFQRSLKDHDCLFISADAMFGKLKTEISGFHSSDHYNFNLEIGYLGNVLKNKPGFIFLVGGQYHAFFDVVLFQVTEAVTFYGLHSIDLICTATWNISEKHSLGTTLSLPAFGLLIRPAWTGWDKYIIEHENNVLPVVFRGRWSSLNDFFAFNWRMGYCFAIGRRCDLTAKYQFRYYRTGSPETAIIPSGQFTIGTRFSF